MSKRNYDSAFLETELKRVPNQRRQPVKKHTLDSDEEDFDEDEGNFLDPDAIEGEEDGVDRQEGEQKMTAFNMKEEMEEGHFDKQGHFIWNNEKEIRDNWLDNIDWQKIKTSSNAKDKNNPDKGSGSDSDTEPNDKFDDIAAYKSMLQYMKPKETVNKSIKRLGAADMKLSSVERLKRKKAGTLNDNKDCTDLTEIANLILTKLGNMDVYQETYEQIQAKIENSEKKAKSVLKEPELDMYADDFDIKEKEKISTVPGVEEASKSELMWEFKWKVEDEDIQGPYSNEQMIKWSKENYFKSGVMVRKCGEDSNFYNSNRIDFELYD